MHNTGRSRDEIINDLIEKHLVIERTDNTKVLFADDTYENQIFVTFITNSITNRKIKYFNDFGVAHCYVDQNAIKTSVSALNIQSLKQKYLSKIGKNAYTRHLKGKKNKVRQVLL